MRDHLNSIFVGLVFSRHRVGRGVSCSMGDKRDLAIVTRQGSAAISLVDGSGNVSGPGGVSPNSELHVLDGTGFRVAIDGSHGSLLMGVGNGFFGHCVMNAKGCNGAPIKAFEVADRGRRRPT